VRFVAENVEAFVADDKSETQLWLKKLFAL